MTSWLICRERVFGHSRTGRNNITPIEGVELPPQNGIARFSGGSASEILSEYAFANRDPKALIEARLRPRSKSTDRGRGQ
jgi:hypothetical protein